MFKTGILYEFLMTF